jgi:hypothetical protein
MPSYIKSHSNYVLRKKHQTANKGTIFERDITTIGGRDNFAPGQVPVYKSGNFVITINNDNNHVKNHETVGWEKNPEGNIWTLDNLKEYKKDEIASDDLTINIKKDYYDLADFAYYGSCAEMIRASINDILLKFPGELYAPYNNDYVFFHDRVETNYLTETDEDGNLILDESGNTIVTGTVEETTTDVFYGEESAKSAGYERSGYDGWRKGDVIGGTELNYDIVYAPEINKVATLDFGWIPVKDNDGNYIFDNDNNIVKANIENNKKLSMLDNPFGIDIHSGKLPKDYTDEKVLKFFANGGYANYEAIDISGVTYNITYTPLPDAKDFIKIERDADTNLVTIRNITTNQTGHVVQYTPIEVIYEISGTVVEGEDVVYYSKSDKVVIQPNGIFTVLLDYLSFDLQIISADYVPCVGSKLGEVAISIYSKDCDLTLDDNSLTFDYAGFSQDDSVGVVSQIKDTPKDNVIINVYVGNDYKRVYLINDTDFGMSYFFDVEQSLYDISGTKGSIRQVISKKDDSFTPYNAKAAYKYRFRPKKEFFDKFITELDIFEQILMNTKSSPLYTATLRVVDENEFGYFDTLQDFTFPTTYGGYNLGSSGFEFETYVSRLSNIATFYDERFSDNLYRSLTHESIKNFDWTYERRMVEDEDAINEGTSKIQKLIRLFGREFDEIKAYTDAISFTNTISYNDVNNLSDYFFTDKLENDGWDLKQIIPFTLYEYAGEDAFTPINDATETDEKTNTYSGKTLHRIFSQKDEDLIIPYSKAFDSWENGYFYGWGDVQRVDSGTCAISADPSSMEFEGFGKTVDTTDVSSTAEYITEYGFGKFDTRDGEKIVGNYFLDGCNVLRNRINVYSSESTWTMAEINNEFMKRLAINSRYILRHKGTIDSVEMMLSFFGMKSRRWYDALPDYVKAKYGYDDDENKPYDYEIKEYTSFTKRIRDPWSPLYNDYTYDFYNSAKSIAYDTENFKNGIYDPYRGLTVAYRESTIAYEAESYDGSIVSAEDKDKALVNAETGELIKTRYIYPAFQNGEIYDGNVYYQMKGGWLNKKPYIFDRDENIVLKEDKSLNKETLRNIRVVDNISDLFKIPTQSLNNGDIFHVDDLSKTYAVVDGVAYELQTDSDGVNTFYYIEVVVKNSYVVVGHAYFYDYIIVSTPYSDTSALRYDVNSGEFNDMPIRIYLMETETGEYTIDAYSDSTTITTFTLFKGEEYIKEGKKTNYFRINNRDYANELSTSGWEQMSVTDNDYRRLNTIINYYNGNNPHTGNMQYDNGHEYFTYFRYLFKYAYENDLFDMSQLNIDIDEEEAIGKLGFHGIIRDDVCKLDYDDFLVEDTKIHYFGNYYTNTFTNEGGIKEFDAYTNQPQYNDGTNKEMSSYTYSIEHISVDDNTENAKNLIYNLENIVPNRESLKRGVLTPHYYGDEYEYDDSEVVDGITNQIINNKRMSIIFYMKNDSFYSKEGISEIKYIDSVIVPYIEQMLPSGVICDIEYRYLGQITNIYKVCGIDNVIEGQPVKFLVNDEWVTMGYIEQGKCTIKIDAKEDMSQDDTYTVKVGEPIDDIYLYLSDSYVTVDYNENTITLSAYTNYEETKFVTEDGIESETGTVTSNSDVCLTFKSKVEPKPANLSFEIIGDDDENPMIKNVTQTEGEGCTIFQIETNGSTAENDRDVTFVFTYGDDEQSVNESMTIVQTPDTSTVDYTIVSDEFSLETFVFTDESGITVASGNVETGEVYKENGIISIDTDNVYSYIVKYTCPQYGSKDSLTVTETGKLKNETVVYEFALNNAGIDSYNFNNNSGATDIEFVAKKTVTEQTYIRERIVGIESVERNGTATIVPNVTTNDYRLSATAEPNVSNWIHCSISDGEGFNKTLSITVDANETSTKRTGYVTLTAYDGDDNVGEFVIMITQDQSFYVFKFNETELPVLSKRVSYNAHTLVYSNLIESTFNGAFINYTVSDSSGNCIGNVSKDGGTVRITYNRNSSINGRSGFIVFRQAETNKEIKLEITQDAVTPEKFDVLYVNASQNKFFANPTTDGYPGEGSSPVGVLIVKGTANMSFMALTDAKYNGSSSYKFSTGWYHDSDSHTHCERAETASAAISLSGNGKETRDKIAASGKSKNDFHSYIAASNYTFGSMPFVEKGKWYMPAMSELVKVSNSSGTINNNLSTINNVLGALSASYGATKLSANVPMLSCTVIRNHGEHEDFPWTLKSNTNGLYNVVSQNNDSYGVVRPFFMTDSQYNVL